VFNELLQVCHNWAPDMCCEEPVPAEMSVYAIKNTRRKMEDKHVIIPVFNKLFQGLVSYAHILEILSCSNLYQNFMPFLIVSEVATY